MAREIVSNKGIANGYAGLDGGALLYSSQVPTNFLTTAAATNHSHGNPQLNLTNINGTTASNSAGLTLSLSVAAQSVQPVAVSGSNGSYAFSTLSFSNANGVSFGTSAGSAIVASHNGLTTAAQSNHSHGNPTLNLTNLSGTTGSASNGFTLSMSAAAPIPIATQVYDVASAGSTGTVTRYAPEDHRHAGVFRMAAGSNVGTTAGDTAPKHGEWVIAVSGNGTMSGSTGAGGVHTAWISIPAAAAAPVGVSAGTTSSNLATVNFFDSNGISFGLNGATITASHNGLTTAALSNHSHGNPQLNLTNISGTTASNSAGFTLSLSAGAAGGGQTKSTYIPYYPASTGTHTIFNLNSTRQSAYYFPVSVEAPCIFNELRLLEFMSGVTTTVAASQTVSRTLGIYSNNAATLSLMSSCSFSMAASFSSISATLSFPTATGTAGYTYGTVTAGSTATMQSLFGTAGNRIVGYQFGNTMSLSEGLYWVGIIARNTTAGASACISLGLCGNVMAAAQNAGPIGSSTAAMTTNTLYKFGWGPYTSTGSAGYGGTALPTSVFMSGIANTMTQMPIMTFISTQ